jgi:hypothetical protein
MAIAKKPLTPDDFPVNAEGKKNQKAGRHAYRKH